MKQLGAWFASWGHDAKLDGTDYSSELGVRLLFEPRDVWVGLFWTRRDPGMGWDAYVCLLPMLPIRISLHRSHGGHYPRRTWTGKGR